jgi:DNA-binding transcriptional LysR family regulator
MQIEDLEIVLKVAQLQNITAAADSLDMRLATASAAVKRVEQQLGESLFIRTTRRLRLSSAGERFLPECEQAVSLFNHAKQNLKGESQKIDGDLRLSVSSDLGRNLVTPWVDDLLDLHPNLRLKMNVSDRNIDFYRDNVDVALRYGSPSDANSYGFKICTAPGVMCASPDYLETYGTPKTLKELTSHTGLFYQLSGITHDVWSFTHQGNTEKLKMTGRRFSNDGDLVRRWCVAGKGITVKSSLDMSDDLLNGRVQQILSDYRPRCSELWLVCPSKQLITPAVRLLRDTLRQKTKTILDKLVEENRLKNVAIEQLGK